MRPLAVMLGYGTAGALGQRAGLAELGRKIRSQMFGSVRFSVLTKQTRNIYSRNEQRKRTVSPLFFHRATEVAASHPTSCASRWRREDRMRTYGCWSRRGAAARRPRMLDSALCHPPLGCRGTETRRRRRGIRNRRGGSAARAGGRASS